MATEYLNFSLTLNYVMLEANEEFLGISNKVIEFCDRLETKEYEKIIVEFRQYSPEGQWAIYSNGTSYDQSQWSNYTAELCNFSKRYPNVMFILRGKGPRQHFFILVNNGKYVRSDGKVVFSEPIASISNPSLWRL